MSSIKIVYIQSSPVAGDGSIVYRVSQPRKKLQIPAPLTESGFLSFSQALVASLRQIGKHRMAARFLTAINSLIRFNGKAEISFADLDSTLIQRYEQYLSGRGLCPNSTSYYMRTLRAIYNRAVEQGLAEQSYPFRNVYTGVAKTVKRALSIDHIKSLRNLDLTRDPPAALARDLFLFSFYARGMAIIDLAHLRHCDLKNGILKYRRKKTGQLLTIRWEPKMHEIATSYYNNESEFIFPMIDSRKPDYRRQFLRSYCTLNRHLKKIGVQLGLAEPLTFHRARHSWASIANDHNVPLAVISEGLGHDSEKTTRIYLASLDGSVIDNANRDIIRLLD